MNIREGGKEKQERETNHKRQPRNGPTTIWSISPRQIRKEYPWEKTQSFKKIVLGKWDNYTLKNETGPVSYTIYKNKFKMDKRPKCEMGNHQNPTGEHRQKPL